MSTLNRLFGRAPIATPAPRRANTDAPAAAPAPGYASDRFVASAHHNQIRKVGGSKDGRTASAAPAGGSTAKAGTPANLDQAIKDTEAHWTFTGVDNSDSAKEERAAHFEVTDLESVDLAKSSPEQDAAARTQLQQNAPLAEAALAKLAPADRSVYQSLSQAMSDHPDGQLALQLMLLKGQLPGSASSHNGQNLLQALDTLNCSPVAAPLDQGVMLAQVVEEAALPRAISQQARGTCTVTAIQIQLASEKPAEYVRLVTGLASPAGQTTLASGKTLKRAPGTEKADDSGRTASSRLIQSAFMELGGGDDKQGIHYDNAKDAFNVKDDDGGLEADQTSRVIHAVTNEKVHNYTDDDEAYAGPKGHQKLFGQLQKALANGRDVVVGVQWGAANKKGGFDDGHELLVTKTDAKNVYYDNPWGQLEHMTRAEFTKRLNEVQVLPRLKAAQ